MDGWNTIVSFWDGLFFRDRVSFKECTCSKAHSFLSIHWSKSGVRHRFRTKNDHTNPEAQTGGTIRHNIGFAYSVQKACRVTNGVEIPKECDDVPKKSEVKTP